MTDINFSSNIIGLGDLLKDDSDFGTNTRALEEEVLHGQIIRNDGVDTADEYQREMDKVQKNIYGDSLDNSESSGMSSGMSNGMSSIKEHTDELGFNSASFGFDTFDNYDNPSASAWSASSPKDTFLNNLTNEEKKQERVNRVMRDIGGVSSDSFDQDIENDDKTYLLQQITMLRATLEDDAIDISKVAEVSHVDSNEKINLVYKTLLLKNDSNRYCSLAEELILAGAHGLAYLFDGERDFFGRKPDLVGWPDTVKIKLRRIRYETSSLIKDVMQDYNVSSGFRIGLELLPSMFLYSRNRRVNKEDTLSNDSAYQKAISELNAS